MIPRSPLSFRRLSREDCALWAEALFWLSIATAAVRCVPFRYIAAFLVLPVNPTTSDETVQLEITGRIRWAVRSCTRRAPWHPLCFAQGLAAHLMLRIRRIPCTVYFGAAPNDGKHLSAHVWVRSLGIDVVGEEIASRFAVLATFTSGPVV
jgi:hypothetical protein